MVNEFYIYCHRKKSNGKCFYIGKGKGYRYNKKQVSISEGYNAVCIGNVCRGTQKSHKGYIWKYE
jgi:hypothetical protein